MSGTIFNMSTTNPAAGLESADVLYNVYPVQSTGAYDVDGHIIWLRNTTQFINGFMLAPSAYVIENNKGGFTDNLIAARYLSVLDLNTMFNGSSTYSDIVNSNDNITSNNINTTATSADNISVVNPQSDIYF